MKYEKGTFTVIPNIDKLTGKNPILQCVYMRLCKYSNLEGICFPSQKTLCENCGIAKNTLKKYLDELESLGILYKKRRYKNNEEISSIYQLLIEGGSTDDIPISTDDIGGSTDDIGGSTDENGTISTELYQLTKPTNNLSKDKGTDVHYGNKQINNLIEIIKKSCSENGLIYSGKGQAERNACKRLLSQKFTERISEFGMTLETFVNNVIMVSKKLKYNTKQVTSAKLIYYNREEIVNKAKQQKEKENDSLSTSSIGSIADLTPYLNKNVKN